MDDEEGMRHNIGFVWGENKNFLETQGTLKKVKTVTPTQKRKLTQDMKTKVTEKEEKISEEEYNFASDSVG